MKKFIISAILIFALTGYAYGWGSHGGHHHRGYYSSDGNSGESVGALQAVDIPDGDKCPPVRVPEPVTILLLGAGLIGLAAGLARKKFKK